MAKAAAGAIAGIGDVAGAVGAGLGELGGAIGGGLSSIGDVLGGTAAADSAALGGTEAVDAGAAFGAATPGEVAAAGEAGGIGATDATTLGVAGDTAFGAGAPDLTTGAFGVDLSGGGPITGIGTGATTPAEASTFGGLDSSIGGTFGGDAASSGGFGAGATDLSSGSFGVGGSASTLGSDTLGTALDPSFTYGTGEGASFGGAEGGASQAELTQANALSAQGGVTATSPMNPADTVTPPGSGTGLAPSGINTDILGPGANLDTAAQPAYNFPGDAGTGGTGLTGGASPGATSVATTTTANFPGDINSAGLMTNNIGTDFGPAGVTPTAYNPDVIAAAGAPADTAVTAAPATAAPAAATPGAVAPMTEAGLNAPAATGAPAASQVATDSNLNAALSGGGASAAAGTGVPAGLTTALQAAGVGIGAVNLINAMSQQAGAASTSTAAPYYDPNAIYPYGNPAYGGGGGYSTPQPTDQSQANLLRLNNQLAQGNGDAMSLSNGGMLTPQQAGNLQGTYNGLLNAYAEDHNMSPDAVSPMVKNVIANEALSQSGTVAGQGAPA